MTRTSERLIDLTATAMLLLFAVFMDAKSPGLAGVVAYAGIQFWLTKNAKQHEEDPDGRSVTPLQS